MERTWTYPEPTPPEVAVALAAFEPILRDLLYRRGFRDVKSAREYLQKDVPSHLRGKEIGGVREGASVLVEALEANLPIGVYGDYDADGVSATALLTEFLGAMGAKVLPYLPDRFAEGYGLKIPAIEDLWDQGARVLVTVDCGVRAVEQVQRAKSLGYKVIVTDHHHPADALPPADVLINPRIAGDPYPFKSFAGVGLAYKLAEAVSELAGQALPESVLDLVALGTVADLAPLREENRRLVAKGLERMNQRSRPGLRALVEVAGLKSEITATDIAFRLAPRINASGRMASAKEPLQLLLTEDAAEAKMLASTLDRHNRRRQAETRQVVERAGNRLLRRPEESMLLFALDEGFHEGVVGLAASRLLDQYYRPVLIACLKEGVVKGSARSVPEFHITEALETCSDLLLEFGGHAAAAGFQLYEEDLEEFYERMELYTVEKLGGELLRPSLKVDAVVGPKDLNVGLLDKMEAMKPFGHGNPAPLLVAEEMHVVEHRRVGSDGAHLKMTLHNDERYFDSIGFRLGDRVGEVSSRLDVAFHYEWNDFRGTRTDQLNIIDFRQPERV